MYVCMSARLSTYLIIIHCKLNTSYFCPFYFLKYSNELIAFDDILLSSLIHPQ